MESNHFDVIVIGAGAAGLAAAGTLAAGGRRVLVLEARDRLGGRIFTQRDPALGFPVELGAEFVHGRPKGLFDIIGSARLTATEITGGFWYSRAGRLSQENDFFEEVDEILARMTDRGPDRPFLQFLDDCCPSGEARQYALGYVSGFHAADPSRVGVHGLVRGLRADEKNDGDHQFRIAEGYAAVVEWLQRRAAGAQIRFNAVVTEIHWSRDQATVVAHAGNGPAEVSARRLLVTLPLGVLKAPAGALGAVCFDPPLEEKLETLRRLEMGPAIRISLRFRERFWERVRVVGDQGGSLENMSFLFSQEEWFPTWWSDAPLRRPLLTGWAAGPRGAKLAGKPQDFICDRALDSLARLLPFPRRQIAAQLEAAYVHDWQLDPYSRGGYSYALVGGEDAHRGLAQPLAQTLFFAGEATEFCGNNATVHGAIASGHRAAREILSSF